MNLKEAIDLAKEAKRNIKQNTGFDRELAMDAFIDIASNELFGAVEECLENIDPEELLRIAEILHERRRN